MDMPETDNIHYQHAYKRGYQLALEGKTTNSMPSAIRRDFEMREYFQKGWEQAHADVAESRLTESSPDWKSRAIWGTLMVLGGIASGQLIIHNYEAEREALAEKIAGKSAPNPSVTSAINSEQLSFNSDGTLKNIVDSTPSIASPISSTTASSESLSLLSTHQRQDLIANQQALSEKPAPLGELAPLIKSDITLSKALFTETVIDRMPGNIFEGTVPKYVRSLYFYTEVTSPEATTLYHRWRFNNQYLATLPLKVEKGRFRTWSSKKMSSAWQGRWDVELLDKQQHVIFRKSFTYGVSP
ncbi:MAG: DUF2914 domain-containing protein [Gammaproteobacteria bacterium]|nr:DUF2914 domain-containing protein [Gammaproteobacteria bacterium]